MMIQSMKNGRDDFPYADGRAEDQSKLSWVERFLSRLTGNHTDLPDADHQANEAEGHNASNDVDDLTQALNDLGAAALAGGRLKAHFQKAWWLLAARYDAFERTIEDRRKTQAIEARRFDAWLDSHHPRPEPDPPEHIPNLLEFGQSRRFSA